MTKKHKIALGLVLLLGIAGLVFLFFQGSNFAVLNPKGSIAERQRELMVVASLLMLIVVLPVFALTFAIAWRYRESNTKATYSPDMDGNKVAEAVWWGVPLAIIAVLGGIIWKSSYELDPFKPVTADNKPITIQVVALQWKWLFIYPEQNIATVNQLNFPEDTPVSFQITADAPMNSFWIPQLGGQVYAMTGMSTGLHLVANEPGTYDGRSANISGAGFAGMKFTATSQTEADFENWVRQVKASPHNLTANEYKNLALPSRNHQVVQYGSKESGLYSQILAKYTEPSHRSGSGHEGSSGHGHDHGHSHGGGGH